MKKAVAGKHDLRHRLFRRALQDLDVVPEIEHYSLQNRPYKVRCGVACLQPVPGSGQARIPFRRALAAQKRDENRNIP